MTILHGHGLTLVHARMKRRHLHQDMTHSRMRRRQPVQQKGQHEKKTEAGMA
jgi:hypothetical protein